MIARAKGSHFSSRRARRARDRGTCRGTTLLELLLVLAIVGIVFGVGFGLLTSLDLGQRAAVGLVKNVLRSARNTALARSAPARVRLDVAGGELAAEALQVVGTWHFEGHVLSGAFGLDGLLQGADLVPEGFIGGAVSFERAARGSTATIPIRHDPSFDFEHGFALELALIYPDAPEGRVIDLGGVAGVDLADGGALEAWFTQRIARDGYDDVSGGSILVRSAPGVLRPGRWYRVVASYDRRLFRLTVDGVPVAELEVDAPVWDVERPLRISDERRFFRGRVDNLVVSAVAAERAVRLPGEVRFASDAPPEIVFAPGGNLDREVHPEPVTVALEYADGRRREVRVGLYGTVE